MIYSFSTGHSLSRCVCVILEKLKTVKCLDRPDSESLTATRSGSGEMCLYLFISSTETLKLDVPGTETLRD